MKSTESLNLGAYQVASYYTLGEHNKSKYTANDIDFLVAYIIPLDVFYLVPIAACPESAYLRLYPQGGKYDVAKLEDYREAWHLLSE